MQNLPIADPFPDLTLIDTGYLGFVFSTEQCCYEGISQIIFTIYNIFSFSYVLHHSF